MPAFYNRQAFIQDFNQALEKGYKFEIRFEEGESEPVLTPEAFIEQSNEDICFLDMHTPSGDEASIVFVGEFRHDIMDSFVEFTDYSGNAELERVFANFFELNDD